MTPSLFERLRGRHSLNARITLGFGVVLVLHLIVAVTGHFGLDRAQVDLQRFDVGRRLSVQMVEIDRLVGEMQRHVLAYTFTGHAGMEVRSEATAEQIADRIAEARSVAGPGAEADLDHMQRSLANYRAAFRLAVDGRERRQRLVDEELVGLTDATVAGLEVAVRRCQAVSGPVDALHRVEVLLLQAVNRTNDYLTRLDPNSIRTAQQQVLAAGEVIETTAWPGELRADIDQIGAVVEPLHGVLVQVLQSTRSYLQLVNVVLAGEAASFLRSSGELREQHLAELDALQQHIAKEQTRFQWISALISVVTIVLGLAASSMIGRSVVRPLQAITSTLSRLAAGDGAAIIPGRDRTDEIGAMATAAQVFRERNEETARLLAGMQTLSMHREQVIADLEKSNQDLDSFAYIASHDLRAPLRAMNAAIEWLEEDCGDRLTESGAGSLELLRGRVRRMNVLLEDLLDYSRTTRTEYEVEEFDLSEVVHDVIGMCAPRQGIEVRVDVDALRVEARRVPLERVLANLVDNAIKHHDRDQGTIDVRATRCDGGIVLTVSDDGPGIDPAYRAKVFEPFRVLQSRDRIEGSGVGLALVALLVDRCGGSVAIESTAAARGVTFRVGWPASIEASETALAPAGEAS